MEDINIADCFKFESVQEKNMWVNDLKKRNLPPGIPLPASIYPPHWDQRRTLVHAIQVAAKDQADMMLPVSEASTKLGDEHVFLHCHRGMLNTKCQKNTPKAPATGPNDIPKAICRENPKVDTLSTSQKTQGEQRRLRDCASASAKMLSNPNARLRNVTFQSESTSLKCTLRKATGLLSCLQMKITSSEKN